MTKNGASFWLDTGTGSAGVLEARPNPKIVIGAAGTGWIPYILDRMDAEWEDQFKNLGLNMKPS